MKTEKITREDIYNLAVIIVGNYKGDNKPTITFTDTQEIFQYNEKTGLYEESENKIKNKIQETWQELATMNNVNECVAHIKRITYTKRENTNNPKLIPFQNGYYDIQKKTFEEYSPKEIFFSKHPIVYDPTALCPEIGKFLVAVAEGDSTKIRALKRIAAYCLYREYLIQKAIMLYGSGANGKCQVKGDKVLMPNGNWKNIEDIKVGDKIISPQKNGHSKICNVINTHTRFEKNIFQIKEQTRKKRVLYACSGNHLVPIIRTYSKRTSKDDSTPRIKKRQIFEYEAQRVSKLSTKKSEICCFTTTAIEFNQRNEKINPYCLGIWLGDGHFRSLRKQKPNWNGMKRKGKRFQYNGNHLSQCISITTKDEQVIQEFYKEYPKDSIRKTTKPNNLASSYNFSTKGKLAEQLTKLKLNGKNSSTKFIPKKCLFSSLKYRKNLLAGLLDSDGFIDKNGAMYYTTKSKTLSNDIKDLVFSLGGYAETRKIIKKSQNQTKGNYVEVSIQFKDKTKIPLKVPFKKARLKKTNKEPRHTGIECVKTKPQQVYGFEIDGESKWYVTNNWLVTHNSVYLNLLTYFLGMENVSKISLQELTSNRFAIGKLYGKNANIFADLESKALNSTGYFKGLTGGDYLTCDRKFRDAFDFKNYAKLLFSCNQIPDSDDQSDAFYRRWLIIPFTKEFKKEEQDPLLLSKLVSQQELSGFANVLLAEMDFLLKEYCFGLDGEDDIQRTRELYQRLSDSAKAFLMDCTELSPAEHERKGLVWSEYIKYCKKNRLPVKTDKSFHHAMQLFYEGQVWSGRIQEVGERVMVWKGLILKEGIKS